MIQVHFGLGNIGRGLIIPTFTKLTNISGIYAVDTNESIVDLIQSNHNQYNLVIVNNGDKKTIPINGFSALLFDDLLNELSSKPTDDYLITFSIGKENLAKVKEHLIELLNKINYRTVIIICFENGNRVSSYFKSLISSRMDNNIYFIDALIDRIVPHIESNNIDVWTEEYKSIILDKKQIENVNRKLLTLWKNIHFSDEFEFETNKKLWLLNGLHLVIGWYQWNLDKFRETKTLIDALKNPNIISFANTYLNQVIDILSHKYNKDKKGLLAYKAVLFDRVQNKLLNDNLTRLTRNTKVKLNKHERILAPLIYAVDHSIKCDAIISALKHGLIMQLEIENKQYNQNNVIKFLDSEIMLEKDYIEYIIQQIFK